MIARLLSMLERAMLPDYARKVRRIDGILVMASEDESEDLFAGVAGAFALLRSLHPTAWQRLQRLAWCIYLDHRMLAAAGRWNRYSGRITISSYWARETPRRWKIPLAPMMASLLVHETTHARHTELGIDEPHMYRRETLCVREELRFARRLGLEALVTMCTMKVAAPLPGDSYFVRLHQEVRQLPMPRPLLWLFDWLIERRRTAMDLLRADGGGTALARRRHG